MSALFDRHGSPWTGAYHGTDKPFAMVRDACHRCGSPGYIEAYRHVEGGICFRCLGSGREPADREVRLYTADQLAKLNATAQRKADRKATAAEMARAKAQAEASARRVSFEANNAELLAWLRGAGSGCDGEEYRDGFLGDMLRRADRDADWSDGQREALLRSFERAKADAERARASGHVGTIGERRQFVAMVERESTYERRAFMPSWGGATETVYITTLRDASGNALVVKSPSFRAAVGERLTIKGTVKDHTEFRGERQTMLARVAIVAEVRA
jgi:hypothetical protein